MWQIYMEIPIPENLKNLEVVSWNPVYLFYSKKNKRQSYNWRKTLIKIIIHAINLPKKENWKSTKKLKF